jgi:hypothetical protein
LYPLRGKTLAKYAVLITFEDVFWRRPELRELDALLAKYQRNEIIFLLGNLNCLLGTWQNDVDFEMDDKLARWLLPSYAIQIDKIRRATNGRVLFSRITLLYLIKRAFTSCPDTGAMPNNAEGFDAIGRSCLMANDLMLPFMPSPDDRTLEKLANILPFSDYMPLDQYTVDIARAQAMFEIATREPALKQRSDFVDLASEFYAAFNMSHITFSEMAFGCSSKFLKLSLNDLASPEAMILRSTFFQRSAIPPHAAQRFFEKLAISETLLMQKVRDSVAQPHNDFTLFQKYPVIELAPTIYVCLDVGFLVEKAGRALFWTIFSELPKAQQTRLSSFWGAVFETYVNSIFGEHYKAKGRFTVEPRFLNGDPAFDACLFEGERLIVFEHKRSTIRADCKYGGDVAKLKAELDLKFVKDDDNANKGVAQLSKGIIRFLDGESLDGVSSKNVRRIYPVLICLDNIASVPYFGRYLSEQFYTCFRRKKYRQAVTPVMTLNISDVENILGYLEKFRLSDILDSRYTKDRGMLSSFSASKVPLLENVQPAINMVRERFAVFGKRMEEDLFPGQEN